MPNHFAQIDGLSISYIKKGTGPLLLLIPPMFGNTKLLLGFIDFLASKFTVIAGHCFGGMISILYADKYGHDSNSLILVDTSYKPPFTASKHMCNVLLTSILEALVTVVPDIKIKKHIDFNKYIGTKDFDIKRIYNDMVHVSLKNYFKILEKIVNYDSIDVLSRISLPALILAGEFDRVFSIEVEKNLSKYLKNSKLVVIPGANHMIINTPEAIADEMLKFILNPTLI